jgi:hypothetical protein
MNGLSTKFKFLIFLSAPFGAALFFFWVTWTTPSEVNSPYHGLQRTNSVIPKGLASSDSSSDHHHPVAPEASASQPPAVIVSSASATSSLENEPSELISETQDPPFLYEIKQDRITTLSPEQQDSVLRVHEQFIEFYQTNPTAFYDESLRSAEIRKLRERVVDSIGIENFEGLIR